MAGARCLGARASRLLPRPTAWLLTFAAVAFAWVFFRSPTFGHALAMVEGLAGMNGLQSDALIDVSERDDAAGDPWRLRWQPTLAWSAVLATLFLVSFTQMSARREFVYFQF